jgi:hypothetical protein
MITNAKVLTKKNSIVMCFDFASPHQFPNWQRDIIIKNQTTKLCTPFVAKKIEQEVQTREV